MNVLKQLDYKHEVELHGYKFKIRPFPAFTAMNMSGEVISFFVPIIAFLKLGSEGVNAQPAVSITGDKTEYIMKKLLTQYNNIMVLADGKTEALDEDLANEVFCGEAQDMYLLAFEVVKVNFPGIFKSLKNRFGSPEEILARIMT